VGVRKKKARGFMTRRPAEVPVHGGKSGGREFQKEEKRGRKVPKGRTFSGVKVPKPTISSSREEFGKCEPGLHECRK